MCRNSKTFCTARGGLTTVSDSTKKIEQLLAFCLPENRAALNCPECHFSAGFLTLGAVEGYNKEKLRGANRVYQGNGRHFAIMSLPLDGTNNY